MKYGFDVDINGSSQINFGDAKLVIMWLLTMHLSGYIAAMLCPLVIPNITSHVFLYT